MLLATFFVLSERHSERYVRTDSAVVGSNQSDAATMHAWLELRADTVSPLDMLCKLHLCCSRKAQRC